MGGEPDRYLRGERAHLLAAGSHEVAARFWERYDEPGRAARALADAERHRTIAESERQRFYAAAEPGPYLGFAPDAGAGSGLRDQSDRLRAASRRLSARTRVLAERAADQKLRSRALREGVRAAG